ncbi:threonine aldolase [Paraphotobacterium marinum]|uniref:Threonine aldolase n=1 Tax=Paraphotobacterium marinum TaxID=1755811 RepID=A0A220VHA9_9GAMM|nr:DSD1 family PLP-dependent enzyme [Paraphotobacterium marinum]ASK79747.1 threonine aldolase [Paraphotobacterium marinum]
MIELDTPALIIRKSIMKDNLMKMQKYADSKNINLRPHTKAHKTPYLANMQIELGASGICVSKLSEAEIMAEHGIKDILITTPIASSVKFKRLVELQKNFPSLVLYQVVDSAYHVEQIDSFSKDKSVIINLVVEVEAGQKRCGLIPDENLKNLIDLINQKEHVNFCGIQAYSGHLQLVQNYESRLSEAAQALNPIKRFFKDYKIEKNEIIISGAGTGTFYASDNSFFSEIQCGSYIFMDKAYKEIMKPNDSDNINFGNSLMVLSTVISKPAHNRLVIDAGMKSLSIDHGMPSVFDLKGVTYRCGGDEHGILDIEDESMNLNIGDQVLLIPSHCDTTLNNFDDMYLLDDNDKIVKSLKISGRGCSQ